MTTAVLCMAYGGPNSLDEVEDYYTDIRGGRRPSPESLADLMRRYEAIGGLSPLPEITRRQAAALGEALEAASPGRYRTYVGMKHWHPFVGEAVINYHLRNYKALIEVDRAYVARASNFTLAHLWLGVGYEGSGQPREAIPEYQRAAELSQGDSDPTAALAHAYTTTGRKTEALKILREWQRQSQTSYVSPYMIATVYAGLGDKDKAFEFLEKAYQERSPDLPYFLRADLRMDSLRSDPRFQDLVHRMNFPQ